MSEDETMEEKQNFLRENILDQGYDVNKFVEFLIDKKGEGGADVGNWSLSDLQIVVQEFINLNSGENQEVNNEPEISNQEYNSEIEQEAQQPEILNQEYNPEIEQEAQPEINQQENEPKQEPIEENNEIKKETKKISMFDMVPEKKVKSETLKQNIEPQKPQVKIESSQVIKEKDKNNEIKKSSQEQTNIQNQSVNNNEDKPNSNTNTNNIKENKNLKVQPNTQNRSGSSSSIGSESQYGVITLETKKCKPTDRTQLGKYNDKLEITVSDPEKKETGFLKKVHINYLISTLPQNFKVRRRFNDVNWFRQTLLNLFPLDLIPVIPRKTKFGSDNLADPFVQKRARAMQRFFNYLVQDPNIKDSQILLDFLYIGNESDFNSKKKVYENSKIFNEVQDYKSYDEKVNLLISGENENYLENIKDNMNININLFKKLNNSFKQLFEEMNAVIKRMEEISNYWSQLNKVSLKYYDNDTTCESYKQMGNLFKTWSNILKEQNNIVNIDIREHFKFIRKNFNAMKGLGNLVEPIKSNYQKLIRNLMSKKDELYKKGNNNQDKEKAFLKMLPKETNNAIKAKEMYGLYLNRALEEYERIRKLNGLWNKNIIQENLLKLMNISSQFHVTVGEINTVLETAALKDNNYNKCKENRIPMDNSLLK